jgi:hypothetical protein
MDETENFKKFNKKKGRRPTSESDWVWRKEMASIVTENVFREGSEESISKKGKGSNDSMRNQQFIDLSKTMNSLIEDRRA